jgi:hypothetical protein
MADGVGVTPRSTINSDLWTEWLVTFGSAVSVLSVLLNAIQSWLERARRDIETIELNGASCQERIELINAYIGRHS